MNPQEARRKHVEYLLGIADEALASARAEAAAGRRRFAINRIYYACFYAASAVFLERDLQFAKHAGVRGRPSASGSQRPAPRGTGEVLR